MNELIFKFIGHFMFQAVMEKRAKIRFFAEQATQIILDMPSNSDMSDLGKTS